MKKEELVAQRRTYTANPDTHEHPYAQLILPMQGELTIETHTGECQMDQQTFYFLPVNCEHTFSSNQRNEFLVLDIPNEMVSTNFTRGQSYQMNDKWKMIRSLVLSEIKPTSSDQASLKALISYIFHHLQFGRLPRSVQYIHDHYDESIPLERLARLEHYHVSYYSNWFLKKMGKSPSLYIQEIRFEKAKELLRHTDLSILKIAMNVGLGHQSSLTRLFQKYTQLTPSQYRSLSRLNRK